MKKILLVLICLAGLLMHAPRADAQVRGFFLPGWIHGDLNYCGGQNATRFTTISTPGSSFSVQPDYSGDFNIYFMPAGTYSLVFDFPGDAADYQINGIEVQQGALTELNEINVCRDLDKDTYTEDVDCNDNNPDINPNAEEECRDAIDNNCNGFVNEGCAACEDFDNDGFFGGNNCGTQLDCNDLNATVNPKHAEICDTLDNDCDLLVDEDFDLLNDEINCGTCGNSCAFFQATAICVRGNCEIDSCLPGFANCDQDDSNGCEVNLDIFESNCGACGIVCANGEACLSGTCICRDKDDDGFIDKICGGDDCNDNNSSIFPGAVEICDSKDNDCDGQIDEGSDFELCGIGECVNGVCEAGQGCAGGETFCGAICTDTDFDELNCGSCGTVCAIPAETCSGGVCFNG